MTSGLRYDQAHPAPSKLVANPRLNPSGRAAKDTRYVPLSTEGANLEYETGDALRWPTNCPELVDELLPVTALRPMRLSVTASATRLGDALARHFDITRPHPDTLAFIASRSTNARAEVAARRRPQGRPEAMAWGQQLADVLHEFPVEPSGTELVGMPAMQPRSIRSRRFRARIRARST